MGETTVSLLIRFLNREGVLEKFKNNVDKLSNDFKNFSEFEESVMRFVNENTTTGVSDNIISRDDYIRVFYLFLYKNNAYEGYISNCDFDSTEEFLKRLDNIEQFVCRAFTWSGSPEGGSYWSGLHDDWIDVLSNKLKISKVLKNIDNFEKFKHFMGEDNLSLFVSNIENNSHEFSNYFDMVWGYGYETGHYIIMEAFSWFHSNEGLTFWEDLNEGWMKFLNREEENVEMSNPSFETAEGGQYNSLESAIIDQSFYDTFGYAVINSDTDFGKKFLSCVVDQLGEEGRKAVLKDQYEIKEVV